MAEHRADIVDTERNSKEEYNGKLVTTKSGDLVQLRMPETREVVSDGGQGWRR